MNQLDFYRERAAAARRDAAAATLENVRDRCMCAAIAWDEMAARAERTERMRAETEAARRAMVIEVAAQ